MSKTDSLKAFVLDTAAMDDTIRPQDDFYRYVNGKWLQDHVIPADRASDGEFYRLRDLSEDQTHEIVKEALAGTITGPEAERIAILYGQFMDQSRLNHLGAAPLQPLLSQIQKAETHADLAFVMGDLARSGMSGLFACGVAADLNDTARYAFYFEQAGLGLPDESYYSNDEYENYRVKYQEHIAAILTLVGVTSPESAEEAAAEVLTFETLLAGYHWDIVKSRDVLAQNNPRTFELLTEESPGFNWEDWDRGLGISLADKNILVSQPDYVAGAASLWKQTHLHTLKYWLARMVADAFAPYLSDAIAEETFDFYGRTLAGIEKMRPRWKRALGLVEDLVGFDLGKLYVQRHFPAEYKERMDHLVQNLLDAYRESIKELDWMGEDTKALALAKLHTFTPKIGYPEKWRDNTGMQISDDKTLVQNVLAAEEFETEWEFSKLGTPVDRLEWMMTPQTVNAYYYPSMNEIVFPAAILQPPFFNPEADDAVNYAGIGAVIGHEIGHGFDDQGSQFDADGNVSNWWTDADREAFEERTKALIDQYDQFSPAALGEEHKVNGALTIGENIGDLGGLMIAWKAWQRALAEEGIDSVEDSPEIDGLSGAERFFASWARIWRGKHRDDYAIQLLAVDPHSPAEFRCNGILANFDAFADYYGLKEGDGLWIAPEDRVTIW